jgi:hypothetical protein
MQGLQHLQMVQITSVRNLLHVNVKYKAFESEKLNLFFTYGYFSQIPPLVSNEKPNFVNSEVALGLQNNSFAP